MSADRLPPGIRRTPYGYEARVMVRGEIQTRRFPPTASMEEMQGWLTAIRERVLQRPARLMAPIAREAQGTIEADIASYLARIEGRTSFKADRSHLRAWLPFIGSRPRALVTTADVDLAIAAWRRMPGPKAVRRIRVTTYRRGDEAIEAYDRKTPGTSGQVAAVRTIRHRCRVLADLYHTLDGKRAWTPIDEAKVPKLEPTFPQGIDVATIFRVAEQLAVSAHQDTYARYLVLVSTGQRPIQLMRAQPGDWNLRERWWRVRSAKNAPVHTITLSDDMVYALETFEEANAWGLYDETLHARRVHAAGWPKLVRPYNARHAVMIHAVAKGIDLGDVQGLAGHTSPLTTRRFYAPFSLDRQRRVTAQLEGRLNLKSLLKPRLVKRPAPSEESS